MNLLFPHTWLAPGCLRKWTKGSSVWTVATSQTHAVSTIRFYRFNPCQEHVGAVWHGSCAFSPSKQGKKDCRYQRVKTFYCSMSVSYFFFKKPGFSTKTKTLRCAFGPGWACYCWVWTRQARHSSPPWLDSDPFSLPLVSFISECTSHVSATRGRGTRLTCCNQILL